MGVPGEQCISPTLDSTKKHRLFVRSAVLLVSLGAAWLAGQGYKNPPVRLLLDLQRKSIAAGEVADVTVRLRDAYNNGVVASKEYWIWVEVRSDGTELKERVLIKPGAGTAKVSFRMERSGIFLIKALHSELREDSVYIRVGRRRTGFPRPQSGAPLPGGNGLYSLAAWGGSQPPLQPAARVDVTVKYSDQGAKLAANGSDAVRIQVILSDEAPGNITVQFAHSGGSLQPNPLVITRGEVYGEATLTSTAQGEIEVECVYVRPRELARLVSGAVKRIFFAPSIKELRLTPSPPRVPLGDKTELQVELIGLDDRTVATHEPKDIHFTLHLGGLGDFSPPTLTILKDAYFGRTDFKPRKTGLMRVSAATFGATTREPQVVDVVTPWTILLGSVIGGFLGGLLRAWRSRIGGWRAVVVRGSVGSATGFVLSLACMHELVPGLPATLSSNYLGVLLVSIPGGWLGTEVIELVVGLVKGKLPKLARP